MQTITIETIHAGQPRPYADSFYEAKLTFTENGKPLMRCKEWVAGVAKALVRYWEDVPANHWAPTLNFLKPIDTPNQFGGASIWHVKVTEAYTD